MPVTICCATFIHSFIHSIHSCLSPKVCCVYYAAIEIATMSRGCCIWYVVVVMTAKYILSSTNALM